MLTTEGCQNLRNHGETNHVRWILHAVDEEEILESVASEILITDLDQASGAPLHLASCIADNTPVMSAFIKVIRLR